MSSNDTSTKKLWKVEVGSAGGEEAPREREAQAEHAPEEGLILPAENLPEPTFQGHVSRHSGAPQPIGDPHHRNLMLYWQTRSRVPR